MRYLIGLEWKKWNKNLGFRLLLLSYIVFLPSLLLTGKRLDQLPTEIGTNEVFFIFPTVWQYLGYVGNWLTFFFFGFLAVLIVTTEYNNKTLRQNIINGISRERFFLGKVYFVLLISLGATLYYCLCALLIGYFNTDVIVMSKVFQNADYILRYFLMCASYMIFALFLGFLIKRTGIALFSYLAYVMFLELILRWGVHRNIVKHKSMHFYPMNATEDLVPLPFTEQTSRFLDEFGFELFLTPMEAIITTLVYIGLFLLITFRIVKKADL